MERDQSIINHKNLTQDQLKKRYDQLCDQETFKRSEFIEFIKLGLMSYGNTEAYSKYEEELPTKYEIMNWDVLLNVEPQYLVDVGIQRIHQKLFMDGIRKRQLYYNTKKLVTMERPKVGIMTNRWKQAQKVANEVIEALPKINLHLNTNLIKCQEIIDTLLLALFSNQHVLLLGPPGTAKTTIANRVSKLIQNGSFFYNLMTRFTTPDQIFGPVSLPSLKQGQLSRNTQNYLPTATIALLDEIFKSSSIILNSILDVLNQRVYKNNGKISHTPILTVIGTSNDEAIAHDLTALFDRFAFRFWTKRLDKGDLLKYLSVINNLTTDDFVSTYSFTWDVAVVIKESSKKIKIPQYVLKFIVDLVKNVEIDISQRRIKKALQILKVNSKLANKQDASCLDCLIFKNIFAGSEQQIKQFLIKFQELYVQYISKTMTQAQRYSEYVGQIHSSKWRRGADKFKDSLVERLKILVK